MKCNVFYHANIPMGRNGKADSLVFTGCREEQKKREKEKRREERKEGKRRRKENRMKFSLSLLSYENKSPLFSGHTQSGPE